MTDELGPFDPALADLLSSTKSSFAAPAAAKARVAARLAESLGIPIVASGAMLDTNVSGTEADVGAEGLDGADAAADAAEIAAEGAGAAFFAKGATVASVAASGVGAAAGTAAAGGAALGGALGGGAIATAATAGGGLAKAGLIALLAKPLVIGSFVAGSVVGGGTVAVVNEVAPPKVVYVPERAHARADRDDDERDEENVEPVPAPVELPVEPLAPPQVKKKIAKKERAPRVQREKIDDDVPVAKETALARERSLLEIARTALARGDAKTAFNTLELHRKQHPSGKLSEERDGLAVLALVGLGRETDAKARARTFEASYPKSLLLPAIEDALR